MSPSLEQIAAAILLLFIAGVIRRRRLVRVQVLPIETWDFGPPESNGPAQLETARAMARNSSHGQV